MIYRLILILSFGGTPEEFVGSTVFESLRACNMRMIQFGHINAGAGPDWLVTCRGEYRA